MVFLQVLAGLVLGLGGIVAVFWFTFRQPPPHRPSNDRSTSTSDIMSLLVNDHNDVDHGSF